MLSRCVKTSRIGRAGKPETYFVSQVFDSKIDAVLTRAHPSLIEIIAELVLPLAQFVVAVLGRCWSFAISCSWSRSYC